jgi:hypothetical protein
MTCLIYYGPAGSCLPSNSRSITGSDLVLHTEHSREDSKSEQDLGGPRNCLFRSRILTSPAGHSGYGSDPHPSPDLTLFFFFNFRSTQP